MSLNTRIKYVALIVLCLSGTAFVALVAAPHYEQQPASPQIIEVHPTIAESTAAAQRIALVEVVSSEPRYSESGNIWTYTIFAVLETAKGQPSKTIETRVFGGTVGSVTIDPPRTLPSFERGERFVAFFGPTNTAGYVTVAPDGFFRVEKRSGSDTVRIPAAGAGREIVVPLADFLHTIKSIK